MNIKALLKSLVQRRFTSALLLLQLALTLGLIVNSVVLSLDTREKLLRPIGLPLEDILIVESLSTSKAFLESSYYRSILEEDLAKINDIPGVNAVAPHIQLPIQNGGWNGNMYDANEPDKFEGDVSLRRVAMYYSTPDALKAFDNKVVEGRELTWADEIQDGMNSEDMNIIISKSLADKLFPDSSAIGKITNRGRIVGVSETFINSPFLDDDTQYYYFVVAPMTNAAFTQHYAINVEPGQMEYVRSKIEEVILGVQSERDILNVYTMAERHHNHFSQDRGLAGLFAMLCGLMLLVTAISSFAHAQFHISSQKKLIGIRRALGATKKDILLYVLTENWLMSLLGCIVGIAFVIGLNVLLGDQITISKPSIALYFLAAFIIWLAGTVATWIPALKTSKIPPVIATRTV